MDRRSVVVVVSWQVQARRAGAPPTMNGRAKVAVIVAENPCCIILQDSLEPADADSRVCRCGVTARRSQILQPSHFQDAVVAGVAGNGIFSGLPPGSFWLHSGLRAS